MTSSKPERYSYGWRHGPAGDAQVFRLLGQITGDATWTSLEDRCWQTVTTSGLPRRIRPGFWDNNGRCCGTAGVLALACDREVTRGDGLGFADVLVADLVDRATRDAQGVRWSNVEHRDDPPDLAPRHGWAMGNAGIARELLRHARLGAGEDPGYAGIGPTIPRRPQDSSGSKASTPRRGPRIHQQPTRPSCHRIGLSACGSQEPRPG